MWGRAASPALPRSPWWWSLARRDLRRPWSTHSWLPTLPLPPVAATGPPPKSFDAWGPLVKSYNDKLLDGKPRSWQAQVFPHEAPGGGGHGARQDISRAHRHQVLHAALVRRDPGRQDLDFRRRAQPPETGSLHIVGGQPGCDRRQEAVGTPRRHVGAGRARGGSPGVDPDHGRRRGRRQRLHRLVGPQGPGPHGPH